MDNIDVTKTNDIVIVHEDTDVIVIDKPVGMMVHTDGRSTEPTVVDWLLQHAPEVRGIGEEQHSQNGEPLERSGVVHRLDRETSGVLILAKTAAAFTYLKTQFHDRQVKKEYRAFVYGTLDERYGTIDRPIGRSAKDFRKKSAEYGARGVRRPAVTDWERIGQDEVHAYIRLMPRTGRTHQLRVHCKAIGRPIVGDTLYAPAHLVESSALEFDRLALHAYQLTLTLPSGEAQTFTAPLPESFTRAEQALAAG